MAEKKPEVENTAVSPEKLAAWANVRETWKKFKHVTPELLDAEEEAKDTD
jgi:hypothetical protein